MPQNPSVIAGSPDKESNIPSTSRFQVLPQQIGRGTYSAVHLGRDLQTGRQIAVKVMDLRKYEREFETEIRVLALLGDCPGVVRLNHSQIIRDTGYIYMEYVQHPNLFNYLRRHRRLPQDRALAIFSNLLATVEAIHEEGIAHRDLKPDNIMVDPVTSEIILLDFGLSMVVPTSGLSDNYCGSPMYMSPEILNRERHDPKVADIWSLGVILYHMLVGESPWAAVESLDELLDLVVFETHVKLPSVLSPEVQDLLGGVLVHDPKDRLSLADIKQKLQAILTTQQ